MKMEPWWRSSSLVKVPHHVGLGLLGNGVHQLQTFLPQVFTTEQFIRTESGPDRTAGCF